jgi:hypothetical protein
MKVGLSLSLCIRDMLLQETPISDVEYIICGTAMRDEESFARVVNDYSRTYWRSSPSAGIRIAKTLWKEGRLLQPRLRGAEPPQSRNAIWLEAVE